MDAELVRRGLARSRGQARELVDAGTVAVDGRAATKASTVVPAGATLSLTAQPDAWVGRAAYKLLAALGTFGEHGLAVRGAWCLDVGASTGGFTQVLLQAGAAHVTALDVGHGQLAREVADDPRVEERSGTNIRRVAKGDLGPLFDVVVADLSFISLQIAAPPIARQLREGGDAVLLVKPQFEVGRDRLARTGVVTSANERTRVVMDVLQAVEAAGLRVRGLIASPIDGGQGNREYVLWATSGPGEALTPDQVRTMVERADQARDMSSTQAGS